VNASNALAPPRPLQFCFKGDRDYIQGADIFNALVGIYPAASLRNVHFTIHGFVRSSHCNVYEADSRDAVSELRDTRARASFDLRGVTRWVALKEASAPGLAERCEYPEDRVTSLCDIQHYCIALDSESPFTFIETVVAMNKYLHQKAFADAVGKWIFAGIDLEGGCDARQGLVLKVGRDINYRLTRTEMTHNGNAIGSLFFSLVKQ
jgi:hypothetical protein